MKIRAGFVSNSSSEAFICRSSHSVKEMKKILQEMLAFHNKMFGGKEDFYDVFEDPTVASKEVIDDMRDNWMMNISVEDYSSILLYSASDNSIPYTLFEMIEKKFEAKRVHLG